MTATAARLSPGCRRRLTELSRYLDGELTPARRRRIEQHLADCECCGTLTRRMRRTIAACHAEGRVRPPRAVRSKAAERIGALVRAAPPRARLTGVRH
jgi:anti-sigma factor RsiW